MHLTSTKAYLFIEVPEGIVQIADFFVSFTLILSVISKLNLISSFVRTLLR